MKFESIPKVTLTKIHLKMLSANWQPFCSGLAPQKNHPIGTGYHAWVKPGAIMHVILRSTEWIAVIRSAPVAWTMKYWIMLDTQWDIHFHGFPCYQPVATKWNITWTICLGNKKIGSIRHWLITRGWPLVYDDVMTWGQCPHYLPFVLGIYRYPIDSQHKGQVMRAGVSNGKPWWVLCGNPE